MLPTSAAPAPDPATPAEPAAAAGNSSAGMGRSVASGGAWTALGEVARVLTALVASILVARILGERAYGVWSLATRVGSSLSFGDAGVGVASTKYVSQAYARGDQDGERRALWASLVVGLVPSLLLAILMLAFAPWLVRHVFAASVPPDLRGPASLVLQLGALAFALRTVTAVFNSPLLARMRIKQNTLLFYSSVVLQIALTPLALRFGGMAWGALVPVVLWILTGAAYLMLCARVLPGSLRPILDRGLLRSIARLGVGTLITTLAAQVLGSADAIIVGQLRPTAESGYYNVAFQASNMLAILPIALGQVLMPAASRLLAREEHADLQELLRNTMRVLCLALPPILAVMCVGARPFLSLWGPAFALSCTPPFLCLLVGMTLNVLLAVPFTLLLAMGRTDLTARIGFLEVAPFLLYTWLLTRAHGILGAAMGRSLRFIIVTAVVFTITSRLAKVSFSPRLPATRFACALLAALAPIALALAGRVPLGIQLVACGVGVIGYAVAAWSWILEPQERELAARGVAQMRKRIGKK